MLRLDWSLAVDRLADRIHDTTHEGFADWNLRDASGPFDGIAFLDSDIVTHQHSAYVILFKIQGDAIEAAGKFQHLAGHRAIETIDLGNPVADLDHRAGFFDVDLFVEPFNLLFNDGTDFLCLNLHGYSCMIIRASVTTASRSGVLERCYPLRCSQCEF